ncbi:hypothetical protein N0V93_009066 [Gnomoniopsis smithogilvyi]|uniref:Heterokaryon incompatibility domain-containing protein n=1 Tax=Gnomoniopsis smithogilvyi TaxID=1191159 RepID=A0A9W9CTA5_9PEZI|nr:hypothetical protein N0V93_009066 [Gnomoniopsis smithogilvyi]
MENSSKQIKWTELLSKFGWPKSKPLWDPKEAQKTRKWLKDSYAKGDAAMYHQRPNRIEEQICSVPLPTRLLDLGSHPKTSRNVQLVITSPEDRGNYVTLSHRWGTTQRLELTPTTLRACTEGIDFGSLPRTYQDAVTVSRLLGFRYLWIDALCIIQGDGQDWLEEAAKMAAVYRNSSCTISTHAAKDDNEGFLHFKRSQGQSVSLLVTSSDLSQRGWVFQERILSKRLLHFTSGGLFLEDASGFVNPDGDTPGTEFYDPWKDNKQNLEDSHHDLCGWYRLIERFTTCRLTYETDRLPAVMGLSKHLWQQVDDGYYAWGLWTRSIHRGLLWNNVDRNPKKLVHEPDSANPTAPSWSWGSWTGKVKFPDHLSTCEPECALVGFETGTTDNTVAWPLPVFKQNPPNIELILKRVNLRDIKVSRKYAPAYFMGMEFCHSITDKGIDWVSLDGERDKDVVFAQLTFALVAHHHNVETFSRDDDVIERHTWTHYFLLLSPTEENEFIYRRVGLGASKSDAERAWNRGIVDNSPLINPRARNLFNEADLGTVVLY